MAHHFKSFGHDLMGASVTINEKTAFANEAVSFGENRIQISENSNQPNEEDYLFVPLNGDQIIGTLYFYADTTADPPQLMASITRDGQFTSKGDLVSGGGDRGFDLTQSGGGIVIFGTTDPVLGNDEEIKVAMILK